MTAAQGGNTWAEPREKQGKEQTSRPQIKHSIQKEGEELQLGENSASSE